MISIVITSFTMRRLPEIQDLLDSIHLQSQQDLEVIYVIERSKELHKLVESLLDERGIRSKVIFTDGQLGLAPARNLGIESANGEIIGFVDDDVVLDKDWCKSIVSGFELFREMDGATGPSYPLWVEGPIEWLPLELDWLIGCTRWFTSEHSVEVSNVWGMNMCFSRKSLKHSGGFLSNSGMRGGHTTGWLGEDVELSYRLRMLGKHLYFLPGMRVRNKVYRYKLTNRTVAERSIRVGYDRGAIAGFNNLFSARSLESEVSMSFVKVLQPARLRNHVSTIYDFASSIRVSLIAIQGLCVGYLLSRIKLAGDMGDQVKS